METQVLGLSVDSNPCLVAWAESLDGITYPLLSDFYPHGSVAELYGVLREEGKSERAIFVVDKDGIIRYVDVHDIDLQPDNDVLIKVLQAIDPEAAERAAQKEQPELPVYVEPDHPVVMYCTSWCPGCRRAREWFKREGIDYVEVDITKNRSAAALVSQWTGGHETTPTFKINGQHFALFDIQKIETALKGKKI